LTIQKIASGKKVELGYAHIGTAWRPDSYLSSSMGSNKIIKVMQNPASSSLLSSGSNKNKNARCQRV
jgi:hypothetical protein